MAEVGPYAADPRGSRGGEGRGEIREFTRRWEEGVHAHAHRHAHAHAHAPIAASQALSPYAYDSESRSTPRRLKASGSPLSSPLALSPGATPPPRDRSPDTGLTIRTPRGLGQEAWDRRRGR